MKTFLNIYLFTLVAFLVVGVTGCGGDSDDAGLTKKQFVRQAKAICGKAETEQFKTVVAYLQGHPSLEQKDAIVPAGLPPIEKELEQLQDLGAPSGDETQLDEFFLALEKAIAETKKDPESALVRKDNPFNKPNELAESYGLESCSGNP